MRERHRMVSGAISGVGLLLLSVSLGCGTEDQTLADDSVGPDAGIVIPSPDSGPAVPDEDAGILIQPDEGSSEGSAPTVEPETPPEPVGPDEPVNVDEEPPWEGACVEAEVLCSVRGLRSVGASELSADLLTTLDCEARADDVDLARGGFEYSWTVHRPSSSSTTLTSESAPDPSLFLDAAGVYDLELELLRGSQVVTCQPGQARVFAQPGEDIAVEIFWVTPGDLVPDDGGAGAGADVDLHFLHNGRGACWGDIPWDCHWRNKLPDWGVVGDDSDNCGIDLDDTDGWGPENTNLNNPENAVYSVGVEYWDDWTFGESTVHVNVYIYGQLVYEAERTLTSEKDFWHVADIDWATQTVIEVDEYYSSMESAPCGP